MLCDGRFIENDKCLESFPLRLNEANTDNPSSVSDRLRRVFRIVDNLPIEDECIEQIRKFKDTISFLVVDELDTSYHSIPRRSKRNPIILGAMAVVIGANYILSGIPGGGTDMYRSYRYVPIQSPGWGQGG